MKYNITIAGSISQGKEGAYYSQQILNPQPLLMKREPVF